MIMKILVLFKDILSGLFETEKWKNPKPDEKLNWFLSRNAEILIQ
jgi:hypothetical protein